MGGGATTKGAKLTTTNAAVAPAAGGSGSFDYSKFMGGKSGGASPGGDWEKFIPGKKNATNSAAAPGGAPGMGSFDYKSAMGQKKGGKGGAAGPDWGAFMPGAKMATTNSAAAAAPASPGAGGFDWGSFMPGAKDAGKKGDKKDAASSSPAGAFDYSKFMGGAGVKLATTNNAAAASSSPSGGFDYSKFMAKLADRNMAAGGAPGGGFDWSKFVPKMNGTSKLVNSAAEAAAPPADGAAPPADGAAPPAEPAPGTEGAPCGATPYKDFGSCNKKLKCERHKLFTDFAPGKCVAADAPPASVNNVADATSTSAGDLAKMMKADFKAAGSAGGPCGKWELGGMDFGDCKDDLLCVENNDVSLTYFGKSYKFPNTCKEPPVGATPVAALAGGLPTSVHLGEASTDADADADDTLTADDVKAAAKKVAEAANKAALDAADAAEVMAKKLLAAAAQVRDAAAKLKAEADGLVATDSTEDTTAMLASTPEGGSHWMLTSVAVIAAGSGLYVWRKREAHAYQRI
jgi:hypothetical protein